LDVNGERLVNHYDFYAAFLSQEEFRIVHDGVTLGSMPILHPLRSGSFLIFAGRRWEVVSVDTWCKLIDVTPAAGGRVPVFGGEGLPVHGEIRREMRRVYCDLAVPPYLDDTAAALLLEGRAEFNAMRLGDRSVVEIGEDTLLFPWAGTLAQHTLALLINDLGLKAAVEGVCIVVDEAHSGVVEAGLHELCGPNPGSAVELAKTVQNKVVEKHHPLLTEDLLTRDYASSRIDIPGALVAARMVLTELSRH
jgi:ATP-dependent Lhr-like helicase